MLPRGSSCSNWVSTGFSPSSFSCEAEPRSPSGFDRYLRGLAFRKSLYSVQRLGGVYLKDRFSSFYESAGQIDTPESPGECCNRRMLSGELRPSIRWQIKTRLWRYEKHMNSLMKPFTSKLESTGLLLFLNNNDHHSDHHEQSRQLGINTHAELSTFVRESTSFVFKCGRVIEYNEVVFRLKPGYTTVTPGTYTSWSSWTGWLILRGERSDSTRLGDEDYHRDKISS